YCIEGGEETLLDDAGCPVGTTLVVRDLFYNTPARMKFLKKDVVEANSVAGVVDRIALSHPEVSIRFIREDKQTLLTSGDEWELVKQLGSFPDIVAKAAANLDPSLVAAFLYDTAKLFSKFYQNCPILAADSKELVGARLYLAQSTLDVMKEAMDLVLVPFLEKM
ncbi:MAG: hypothetical protein J5700_04410, partial [Treponema sp.]|nr:hypothetical protein [Treponema sp.]